MRMFKSVTRPCSNCEKTFPHTFMGSRCPFCQVTNWKYQNYVIPLAILIGTVIVASVVIFTLSKF